MPAFRLPLSGDVTQLINPMTWFLHSAGNQIGVVNINMGKSSDPDLEQQIIEDVGTYGKQIGQISDALRVLLDNVDLGKLKAKDERAIRAFRFQLDEVDRLKAQRGRT
jgi:hypothetical protein